MRFWQFVDLLVKITIVNNQQYGRLSAVTGVMHAQSQYVQSHEPGGHVRPARH
jgi:hypothetical protein